MIITTYKVCSKCEQSLPLDQFYNNSAYLKYGARDGKQPYCKDCDDLKRSLRYQDHHQQELERAADHRAMFPNKIRQSNYAWRNNNRTTYNAYMRQYRKTRSNGAVASQEALQSTEETKTT